MENGKTKRIREENNFLHLKRAENNRNKNQLISQKTFC